VKKREKKATVDFRVQMTRRLVKTNHPCIWCKLDSYNDLTLLRLGANSRINEGEMAAYKEEESKGVVKSSHSTLGLNAFHDLEAAGSQDDGERKPEATVRGQSCSTKRVPNSHFPVGNRSRLVSK
jgi:hypothetical protein